MKKSMTLMLLGLPLLTQAANTIDSPLIEDYQYGMKLDIAQVTKAPHAPDGCKPFPVIMEYKDSEGKPHRLRYHVLGEGCDRH